MPMRIQLGTSVAVTLDTDGAPKYALRRVGTYGEVSTRRPARSVAHPQGGARMYVSQLPTANSRLPSPDSRCPTSDFILSTPLPHPG